MAIGIYGWAEGRPSELRCWTEGFFKDIMLYRSALSIVPHFLSPYLYRRGNLDSEILWNLRVLR